MKAAASQLRREPPHTFIVLQAEVASNSPLLDDRVVFSGQASLYDGLVGYYSAS